MKKALLLIPALALSATLYAQTDERDAVVNVENDYTPVVIEVGKKTFTPGTERNINVKPVKAEFSKQGVAYMGFPSERDIEGLLPKKEENFPGYARLGYGLTNDIDAKAAYRFDIGKAGTLKAFASFNGFKCDVGGLMHDWDSRMFNTAAGIGYTHRFKWLTLDVDGKFGNDVFNYQNTDNVITDLTDKQNGRNYMLSVGGVSNLSGAVSYKFKGDFEYIARSYSSGLKEGISEGRFGIGGGARLEIFNDLLNSVGMDINLDGFIYNNTLKSAHKGYNDYFSIDIDPYLNFTFGKWLMKVGTKMNFVTRGAAVFSIAPDIVVKNNLADWVTVYGSITGGRENNSFAKLNALTPYWGFSKFGAARLKPTYTIADINIGSRMSLEPVSFEINAGYAYTQDDLLQAFTPLPVTQFTIMHVNFAQANTHHIYVNGSIGCDLFSWAKLSADARYDFWSCNNSDLLAMKPEITANAKAEFRVIEHLTMQLGYNYTRYTKGDTRRRLNDKHDLYARVSYQITKRFGAYIQGNNLLNCKYYDYADYETRGIRGSLGATVNF